MKSLELDAPHAIVVIGIQGSGKTFFAEKFAETFDAPFIEQAELAALAIDDSATEKLVDIMLEEVIKTKRSIVMEIDANTRARRSELTRQLKGVGYKTMFVWVQVDVDSAFSRSHKLSGVDADQHRKNVASFTAPRESENYLVISGKHTYASQARIVLKKLAAPRLSERRVQPPQQRPSTPGRIIVN